MSNAATQSAPAPFGLTRVRGEVDTFAIGIEPQSDGTFLALTVSASKTFRTVKGAAAWLAKRGYGPTGARLAAVAS